MKRGDKVMIAERLAYYGLIGEIEVIGANKVTVKLKYKGIERSVEFWKSRVTPI